MDPNTKATASGATPSDRTTSGPSADLLALGKKAPLKLYHTLLTRVSQGEVLTASEYRTFKLLQEELESADAVQSTSPGDPRATLAGTPTTLKNRKAVADYLIASGWNVKKSTVYNHVNRGLLGPRADGTYDVAAVNTYATANLTRLDRTPVTPSATDPINKQADAVERRNLAQAYLYEHRATILRESHIPREIHERDLSARAATFLSDGVNFIHSHASELVALVDGNPVKIPDLVDHFILALRSWLARYSRDDTFTADLTTTTVPIIPGPSDLLYDPDDPDNDDEETL